MGGRSAEREVSIQSGRAIELSLKRQGFSVVAIDADQNIAEKVRHEKIELAVIALHGRFGEDGTIQGLLDMMDIPYTGSGVLASAIGMNKAMTKQFLKYEGLPTPPFALIRQREKGKKLPAGFSLPVVVKPITQGSTIGVSVVRESVQITPAYDAAFLYDETVLVEEYIPGDEITAGILGEEVLPLVEIIPKEAFYNFTAKYTKGATEFIIPARLSPETSSQVQQLAMKVHNTFGCEGYSRVDFRVTSQGQPYILEINTLPGMTETSLLPKAAQVMGINYDALVTWIVQAALKKRRTV